MAAIVGKYAIKSAFLVVFALWGPRSLIPSSLRPIPNVSAGFETRGIGSVAEYGSA